MNIKKIENHDHEQKGVLFSSNNANIAIQQHNIPAVTLEKLSREGIEKFRVYLQILKSQGIAYNRHSLILPQAEREIELNLMVDDEFEDSEKHSWFGWTDERFFEFLLKIYPGRNELTTSSDPVEQRLRSAIAKLTYNVQDERVVENWQQNVYTIYDFDADSECLEGHRTKECIKIINDKLNSQGAHGKFLVEEIKASQIGNKTMKIFFSNYLKASRKLKYSLQIAMRVGYGSSTNSTSSNYKNESFKNQKYDNERGKKKQKSYENKNSQTKSCYHCGRSHLASECLLKGHPDANRSQGTTWKDSFQGREWAKKAKAVLPWKNTLAGKDWDSAPANPTSSKFNLINFMNSKEENSEINETKNENIKIMKNTSSDSNNRRINSDKQYEDERIKIGEQNIAIVEKENENIEEIKTKIKNVEKTEICDKCKIISITNKVNNEK